MNHHAALDRWQPGMMTFYVPTHAQGNLYHQDVEQGIVTRVTNQYVFVRFGGETTSKACSPRDLR